ncbi:MAG: AI-2E family transporter [Eubacterium sp.]|nr:AI-2E family transporter [Eubacterium sp.]
MKFKAWLKTKFGPYTVAACTAILFYVILTHLGSIFDGVRSFLHLFSPVFIGIIIAYVMDPLVRLFQRTLFSRVKKESMKRSLSILVTVLVVIAGFALLIVALVPQLISSIMNIANNFNSYVGSLERWISGIASRFSSDKVDWSSITDASNQILDRIGEILPQLVNRLINTSFSIGTGFLNGVIAFILAIYFLMDKARLLDGCSWLLSFVIKESHYESARQFLSRCNEILVRYVICDLLDGLIVGLANFIFMKAGNMPYAVLISVIVGITNLAPTFGPIIGGFIGGFILILISPWQTLWFVIFTVILQTVDGYIVKPRLFGGTFGVSSLWILVCIILGGRMFGVAGILIAIPFAAIFDYIIRDYLTPWLQRRDDEKEASDERTVQKTDTPPPE